MKKALTLIFTLIILFSFIFSISASAVKNLLPVTEETSEIYPGTHISNLLEPNNAFLGCWSNLPGAEDGNYVEKGIVTKDSNTKMIGNYSIKLYNEETGCTTANVLVKTLRMNTIYTIQAWVKLDNVISANWGASIGAEFYKPMHTPIPNIFNDSERFSCTRDWTRISLTFKTPNVNFSDTLITFKLWEASGTVWYDGIALTEGRTVVNDDNLENPIEPPTSTPTPTETPSETPTPIDHCITPSSWAKKEVDEAIAAKLVPEALQSKYTSSITRWDFCDLVVNMIEVKSGKKIGAFINESDPSFILDKSPFPDVDCINITAANKLGIVNGRTNGNFDPYGLITRQEAAKMLALTAKALGADINSKTTDFADSANIADWAKTFVDFVSNKGVMNGTGNNNFSPTANYTREQSFLTILRLYKALN